MTKEVARILARTERAEERLIIGIKVQDVLRRIAQH